MRKAAVVNTRNQNGTGDTGACLVRIAEHRFGVQVAELEEDIADMKAIFHEQLNEAVNQLAAARAAQQPANDAADSVAA